MTSTLILASSSPFRRMLMDNAGLVFQSVPAAIDERAIEEPLEREGASPQVVALVLARAKAREVAARSPSALVIGSDQTMSLGSRVYHKPADLDQAREQLMSLSGQTHQLNSAVVIMRDADVLWEHVAQAQLTVRALTSDFVERHLQRVGPKALTSVGGYQLEGEGIQLFSAVDGDYFTILGLPMLPLLNALRNLGAIDG